MRKPRTILRFVRHGATAANLLGLRCGGDLDLALVDAGRTQAVQIGQRVAALEPPVLTIVTSALRRTVETAEIIARVLGRAELFVEPDFAERSLGEWNLLTIGETRSWIEAGLTPPGGESEQAFTERVARAAYRIAESFTDQQPLLVGSKGVARVLGQLAGHGNGIELDNAELAQFDITRRRPRAATEEAL